MLNLDLLEKLNKQSQWQYGKITRNPNDAHHFQSYFSQQIPVFSIEKVEPVQKRKFPFRNYIPIKENTQISTVSPSKPLDLNYKGDSPRADTKIQSLLLPKGSNQDTFREKKNSL